MAEEKNTIKSKVCRKEISEQDCESYDGMCCECWDDQLTEDSTACLTN